MTVPELEKPSKIVSRGFLGHPDSLPDGSQHAFAEKANEIADAIAAVQSLSKEGATIMGEIRSQCA